MIYLILDTNIWLYLANGLDPISGSHYDDLHFELLSELKKLKENKDIEILVNDIIQSEWKRNRDHIELKIKKLQNKLRNQSIFNELRKYTKSNTAVLQKEYNEGISVDIANNKKHIDEVENFLASECSTVPLTDEIKIQVFDLAVNKRAPFHNKKNNTADAAILLSSAEYLKDQFHEVETSAIFVSNNIEDFTDGINTNEFHPTIKELLKGSLITFQRILPSALKLSREIILQIEKYHEEERLLESNSFECRTPFCQSYEDFTPWGYLHDTIQVKSKKEEARDPNQLMLFDFQYPPRKEKRVGIGECVVCGSMHVECPECEEIIYIEDISEKFNCPSCSCKLEIKFQSTENETYLFIDDTEENIENECEE